MARRPRPAVAAVTWRDGVHLTGTPIWCDARRRRDVCFVSSADRVGKAGHGQLIATPQTLALLGASAGHLAVPLRKPFTLGTTRLELLPSGRGAGAAALYVELGTRRVLYAGAIRSEAAEVRECDALVVAAPIDAAKLPALDEAVARVAKWTRATLAAGKRPILVVDSIVDAIEVASALPISLGCPRAVCDAAARAGLAKLRGKGDVQLRVGAHEGARIALDGDFVWPFAATRAQLLAWIDRSGAREVYLTGAAAESIAAALGPPQQMTLFREAAR